MNDDTGVPAAVFALRSKWADLILSGAKTVEIRRSRMNRMIGRMLIYRTGTGLIVGEARVKGMHAAPPETIWREYGAAACLTEKEFDEYAKGADRLYAYRLENPIRYGKPKTLSDIGLQRAPQSWCYLPETGPAGPEPASDHPAEARRLLTAAADQWELHPAIGVHACRPAGAHQRNRPPVRPRALPCRPTGETVRQSRPTGRQTP